MADRPILFSGEMVKAILAGAKSQTRRIVTPQPSPGGTVAPGAPWWSWEYPAGKHVTEDRRCPYGAAPASDHPGTCPRECPTRARRRG